MTNTQFEGNEDPLATVIPDTRTELATARAILAAVQAQHDNLSLLKNALGAERMTRQELGDLVRLAGDVEELKTEVHELEARLNRLKGQAY